eukprot:gene5233-8835_t
MATFSHDSILQEASACAVAAVDQDNQGHCVQAIELYNRAVHLLDQVIGNPAFVNSQQEAEASRCAYMARIEALKHQVNDYPEVFATPSSQQFVNRNDGSITHYPQNHNPSVVDVGIGLVQLANKEGGKHIIRGMQAAANLNQQYKMTDTICNGVKSASTSTVALNEKYKIVDRLKEGATAAYTSAKQINEEHEITKKVGTVAAAGWKKVGEINQEYKVTERVGSALLSGLNYLSSHSQEYLQNTETCQPPSEWGTPNTVSKPQ